MQTEIKIVVFNPTTDPNNFAADVYVNDVRQHCGKGGQDRKQAMQEALKWIDDELVPF